MPRRFLFMKALSCVSLVLCSLSSLSAQWAMTYGVSAAYGFDVSEDDYDLNFSRVSVPPYGNNQIPGYDTRSYTYVRIDDGSRYAINGSCRYAFDVLGDFRASLGFGVELANQSIDYDVDYWAQFRGFNPFGTGDVPVWIGGGVMSVESLQIVPSVDLDLMYGLGESWALCLGFEVGYVYDHADDYDLYNTMHTITKVYYLGEYDKIVIDTENDSGHPVYAVNFGLVYSLGEHVSFRMLQSYTYSGSYRLANVVTPYRSHAGAPSQPVGHDYYGVRIEDLSYWTTQVGLSYEF